MRITMKDETRNKLPPIVVEYIDKLNNKNNTPYQREMYCSMLERIQQACYEEIYKYKNENAKRAAKK